MGALSFPSCFLTTFYFFQTPITGKKIYIEFLWEFRFCACAPNLNFAFKSKIKKKGNLYFTIARLESEREGHILLDRGLEISYVCVMMRNINIRDTHTHTLSS